MPERSFPDQGAALQSIKNEVIWLNKKRQLQILKLYLKSMKLTEARLCFTQETGVRGKVDAMHLDLSSFRCDTHKFLESWRRHLPPPFNAEWFIDRPTF